MKKSFRAITLLLFIFSALFAEEDKYTNYSLARLSFTSGNTYIQRAADLAYEEGVVNMPISEGDRLGTTQGRAEIYLGQGNYLRLNHETKIDFLNLPEKSDDLVQVQIWTGNIYFSVGSLKRDKNIELHTPDVSLYILDKGIYRVNLRDTETEIFVFKGLVEAAGESGSVLIKDAQRLEATDGRFISRPTRFMATVDDGFDRWNEDRESRMRRQLAKKYLPPELEDFEYELATSGNWVYLPPYGQIWIPGEVSPSWRPYSNGRWVWISLSGWTWLPYEPWGWVTFHFGRWHWSSGLGWHWIPAAIWGPGWVSWYWGDDYYGWAPLSYYGYPGVLIDDIYYLRYSQPDYPSHSKALTVVPKSQLTSRNMPEAALNKEALKNLGKITMRNEAPEARPVLKTKEINLNGNKVPLPEKSPSLRKKALPEPRKIRKRAPGQTSFPASPEITFQRYPGRNRINKPKSVLGRLYDRISGGSSKTVKKDSQKESTSNKVKKKK